MASLPGNNLAAELCHGPPREDATFEKETTKSPEVSETSDAEEISYPEGGLEAWLVVFGSFCGM
jgi:hypothetical protein